jgi:hypothetical protein
MCRTSPGFEIRPLRRGRLGSNASVQYDPAFDAYGAQISNLRLQARLGFGHPLARTQMVQPRLEQKGLAQHAFLVKWAVQAPAERAVAQVTLAQRCDEPTEFGRPRRPARRRARRGGRWVASRRSDQRDGGRPGDSVVKPDRREQAAPQRRERRPGQNGRSVGARLHAASSGRYSNKIERC